MGKLTDTIKHLIIINAILFFGPMFLKLDLTNIMALHFPKNEHFGIWQYVTNTFMHADLPHLFFNMLFIWMFGWILEDMWGKNKFLFFYFSVAIGSSIIYTIINYLQFYTFHEQLISSGITESELVKIFDYSGTKTQEFIDRANKILSSNNNLIIYPRIGDDLIEASIFYNSNARGASGALYGIFAASAVMFPNMEIRLLFLPIPLKNKYYMMTLVLADLFLGIVNRENDNIARFAHVGGAVVGGLIAWYWKKNKYVQRNY